jgi:hypothetical protein
MADPFSGLASLIGNQSMQQGGLLGAGMDPALLSQYMTMQPRLAMAQNLMQQGYSTEPTYSPWGALARVIGGVMGQEQMGDIGKQMASAQGTGQTSAQHGDFARLLTQNPTIRDWFNSLPDWQKTRVEVNPPSWLSSYLERTKLGPTDVLAGAPGTAPQTSGMAPDEVTRLAQWYNAQVDKGASAQDLQITRSDIARQLAPDGWQSTFDDKGHITFFQPQGKATPEYQGSIPQIVSTSQGPVSTTPNRLAGDGGQTPPATTPPPPKTPPPPPPPTAPAAGSNVNQGPQVTSPQPNTDLVDGKGYHWHFDADGKPHLTGQTVDGKFVPVAGGG